MAGTELRIVVVPTRIIQRIMRMLRPILNFKSTGRCEQRSIAYSIVAFTVMTDRPEPYGPCPDPWMANVSLPL